MIYKFVLTNYIVCCTLVIVAGLSDFRIREFSLFEIRSEVMMALCLVSLVSFRAESISRFILLAGCAGSLAVISALDVANSVLDAADPTFVFRDGPTILVIWFIVTAPLAMCISAILRYRAKCLRAASGVVDAFH